MLNLKYLSVRAKLHSEVSPRYKTSAEANCPNVLTNYNSKTSYKGGVQAIGYTICTSIPTLCLIIKRFPRPPPPPRKRYRGSTNLPFKIIADIKIEFAKISIFFCWRRNLIRDFLEFLPFPSIIISPGANPKKP